MVARADPGAVSKCRRNPNVHDTGAYLISKCIKLAVLPKGMRRNAWPISRCRPPPECWQALLRGARRSTSGPRGTRRLSPIPRRLRLSALCSNCHSEGRRCWSPSWKDLGQPLLDNTLTHRTGDMGNTVAGERDRRTGYISPATLQRGS